MERRYPTGRGCASWRWFMGLLLAGYLMAGCSTLPDTSGYTAATIQVRQAVATTGDVVRQEVLSTYRVQAAAGGENAVTNFDAAWAASMKSMDAMVAHAQSIEQIVDAGNQGAESARAVADSVKHLVDAVNVDAISGTSASLARLSTDTVAFVYGEYSKYVAGSSLDDALTKFGPSIIKITTLIQAQVGDAGRLFDEQIEAQVQLLASPALSDADADSRYGNWIKQHGRLDTMAVTATQLLAQGLRDNNPNVIAKAKTMIADVEAGREMTAPRMAAYEAKLQTIRQREKAGRSIIGSAENAVAAWGIAHQEMARAVKERKKFSVESLTEAVAEIRTLIQRWREL